MDKQTPQNFPEQPKQNWFLRHEFLYSVIVILLLVVVLGVTNWWRMEIRTSKNLIIGTMPFHEKSVDTNSVIYTDENQPNPANDKLFFAAVKDRILNTTVFQPSTGQIIKSRKIQLDDSLASGSYSTSGANGAVQYDINTGDIYIATDGRSGFDGSCINKDRTCFGRIYKTNINISTKPQIIYQRDYIHWQWVYNVSDKSIYFIQQDEGAAIIKFKPENKSTEDFLKIGDTRQFYELVLSDDGERLYFASQNSTRDGIELFEINLQNKALKKQIISSGKYTETETNVNGEGRLFAYYINNDATYTNFSLVVYDFVTKNKTNVSIDGRVTNASLRWSDSKLLYIVDGNLWLYDVITKDNKLIKSQAKYPFPASKSANYILYPNEGGNGFKVFDLSESRDVFDLLGTGKIFDVEAVVWFN